MAVKYGPVARDLFVTDIYEVCIFMQIICVYVFKYLNLYEASLSISAAGAHRKRLPRAI